LTANSTACTSGMYYTSGAPCVRRILPVENTSRYDSSSIQILESLILMIIRFYYYNNLQKRPAQIILRKRPTQIILRKRPN
jgi:hypothetical protein